MQAECEGLAGLLKVEEGKNRQAGADLREAGKHARLLQVSAHLLASMLGPLPHILLLQACRTGGGVLFMRTVESHEGTCLRILVANDTLTAGDRNLPREVPLIKWFMPLTSSSSGLSACNEAPLQ